MNAPLYARDDAGPHATPGAPSTLPKRVVDEAILGATVRTMVLNEIRDACHPNGWTTTELLVQRDVGRLVRVVVRELAKAGAVRLMPNGSVRLPTNGETSSRESR